MRAIQHLRFRTAVVAITAAVAAILVAPRAAHAQSGCEVVITSSGRYKVEVKTGGPFPVVELKDASDPQFSDSAHGFVAACDEKLPEESEIKIVPESPDFIFWHIAREIAGATFAEYGSSSKKPHFDAGYVSMHRLAVRIERETLVSGIQELVADVAKELIKRYANPSELLTDKGAKFVVDLAVKLLIEEYIQGKDPGLIIDGLLANLVDHLKGHADTLAKNVGGPALQQALKPVLEKLAKEVKALITEKLPDEKSVRADASSERCTWSLDINSNPKTGRYQSVYSQRCGPQSDSISRFVITVPKGLKPGEAGQVTAQALNRLGAPFPLASATITGLAAVMSDGSGEPAAVLAGNKATFNFTVARPRRDTTYPIRVNVVTDKSVGSLTGTGNDNVVVLNVPPTIESVAPDSAGAEPDETIELNGVRVLVNDENADRNNHGEITAKSLALQHPSGLRTTPKFDHPDAASEVSFDGGSGNYVFEFSRSGRVARPHEHGTWSARITIADDNSQQASSAVALEVKDAKPSFTLLKVEPQFVHSKDGRVINITARVEDKNGAGDIVDFFIDATAAGGKRYTRNDGLIETGRGEEHIDVRIAAPFPHTDDERRHEIPAEVRDEQNSAAGGSFLHVGNFAPVSTGTGFIWEIGGGQIGGKEIQGPRDVCPSQPFRVGMIVSDPEGDPLAVTVTLVETGHTVELRESSPHVYIADMRAPAMPGRYTLLYQAKEKTAGGKSAAETRHQLNVRVCEEPIQQQLLHSGEADPLTQNAIILRAGVVTSLVRSLSPDSQPTFAMMRHVLLSWFRPPSLSAYRNRTIPVARPHMLRGGDVLRVDHSSSQGGATQASLSLVATGTSAGDFFRLQGLEQLGPMSIPDGLVVQPLKGKIQEAARKAVEKNLPVQGLALEGYCLDFVKLPPAPGQLYRVADEHLQQQFAPMTRVLQAARQLAEKRGLHPDSDPAAYLDFIKQWSLWARLEKWDVDGFERHFVERTRKSVERSKVSWTEEIERQVRQLVPNRWRDITAVWADADAMTGEARR